MCVFSFELSLVLQKEINTHVPLELINSLFFHDTALYRFNIMSILGSCKLVGIIGRCCYSLNDYCNLCLAKVLLVIMVLFVSYKSLHTMEQYEEVCRFIYYRPPISMTISVTATSQLSANATITNQPATHLPHSSSGQATAGRGAGT